MKNIVKIIASIFFVGILHIHAMEESKNSKKVRFNEVIEKIIIPRFESHENDDCRGESDMHDSDMLSEDAVSFQFGTTDLNDRIKGFYSAIKQLVSKARTA